jgi:hypothetical protein
MTSGGNPRNLNGVVRSWEIAPKQTALHTRMKPNVPTRGVCGKTRGINAWSLVGRNGKSIAQTGAIGMAQLAKILV